MELKFLKIKINNQSQKFITNKIKMRIKKIKLWIKDSQVKMDQLKILNLLKPK